ncbi:MAG: glycerate kinase [Flammeovirgaceae bacterium]
MNILIAPDKFKDSLTVFEVCEAIEEGLLRANPSSFIVRKTPLADGGDGFLAVMGAYLNLQKREIQVYDPLFRKIHTHYFVSEDKKIAFLEMAKASGLMLLSDNERNPLWTSTYGTGEMIKDALEQGVQKIILGIGGSATNDAGIGMASALGFRFLDYENQTVNPIGNSLNRIKAVEATNIHSRLKDVKIEVACDVKNPFFGKKGAAFSFAAQKGASEREIEKLDEGLKNISKIFEQFSGIQVQNVEGTGAAGGLGGGAIALLGATLKRGFEIIGNEAKLEEKIQWADIIISGEGKLDASSFEGKVIGGVYELSRKYQKPLIALCGNIAEISDYQVSDFSAFCIAQRDMNLKAMQQNAYGLLKNLSYQIGKVIAL